ncbi:hypothetical protein [Pleurocapsa sp. PCC 7319]|uniref:hypothetical protein n=1 Tax=Pleurocapsa sp. PCC 7319 TaxID=118161 RepID=UPI000346BCAA|nr:hypothetical protein [Pleurocapsa sp. PCC 7319]
MIRIKGVVKTANEVQHALQNGILASEANSFKKFVKRSLKEIEQICDRHNTSPSQLPKPSRNAYNYLKSVDLSNLPLVKIPQSTKKPPIKSSTLRLKNVVKQQSIIQTKIDNTVQNQTLDDTSCLRITLQKHATEIENICHNKQLTPTDLATPSRRAYSWMKFLSNSDNLQLHLNAVTRGYELAHKIIKNNRLNKQISITFGNYSGLYKYKTHRHPSNLIEIQLSEGFIRADDSLLEIIIKSALLGKNKIDNHQQSIRKFSMTDEYCDLVLELDLIADIDAEKSQGNYYDLEQLFANINRQYFANKMAKPRLTWNQISTKRKLGHYERTKDRVVISRTLDRQSVPKMVVELVLYHELLHKYYGVQFVNGKFRVHTSEFRRSEQEYQHYQAATKWINNNI